MEFMDSWIVASTKGSTCTTAESPDYCAALTEQQLKVSVVLYVVFSIHSVNIFKDVLERHSTKNMHRHAQQIFAQKKFIALEI